MRSLFICFLLVFMPFRVCELSALVVPDDEPTIEKAYNKVKDGGIITIKPGKYELPNTMNVKRAVTFRSDTGRAEDVIIECSSDVFFVDGEAGKPSFQNLTIRSRGDDTCFCFMITGKVDIFHCIISAPQGTGILARGKNANPRIESCIVKDCQWGIMLFDKTSGEIQDCEVCNNKVGISVSKSANPKVTNCIIHDNELVGIESDSSGLGLFTKCNVYKNVFGFSVRDSGNPQITNCKIRENLNGIQVDKSGLGTFKKCEIYTNKEIGIFVGSSGNPTIVECKIHNEIRSIAVFQNGLGSFSECEIFESEGPGIIISEGSNSKVSGCIIHHSKNSGILVALKSAGEIQDCEIYKNVAGIEVQSSGNPTISDCIIYNNVFGIVVHKNGLGKFRNCEIYENEHSGMQVEDAGKPNVSNCKIHHNSPGIGIMNKGMGIFNQNILSQNSVDWYIKSDAGKISGANNKPKIPETSNSSSEIKQKNRRKRRLD